MNKKEFYEELFSDVEFLEKGEVAQLKEYYEELICDGMEAGASEAEVIGKLENPQKVAERLKREHVEKEPRKKSEPGETDREKGVYTSSGNVKQLVLHAQNRGIVIRKSPDSCVRIYCKPDEYEEIIDYESEGCFFFRQATRRGLRFISFNFQVTYPIEVEIPDGMESIEIRTTNSSIKGGFIKVADELKLATENGGIRINDLVGKRVTATTVNAAITIEEAGIEEMTATTSNGRITLNRVAAAKSAVLTSSNAALHFDQLDSPNIRLKTSNGAIKGYLKGRQEEYSIHSRSSNGHNNLSDIEQKGRSKKLSAITSNGRIHIEFQL